MVLSVHDFVVWGTLEPTNMALGLVATELKFVKF